MQLKEKYPEVHEDLEETANNLIDAIQHLGWSADNAERSLNKIKAEDSNLSAGITMLVGHIRDSKKCVEMLKGIVEKELGNDK